MSVAPWAALLVDIDNTICWNDGPFGPLPPEELKRRLLASGLLDPPATRPGEGRMVEEARLRALAPREEVCAWIRAFPARERVWFLTSRPAWLRPVTAAWLGAHGLAPHSDHHLLLRAAGDRRPAEVVKAELFLDRVAPGMGGPPQRVALLDDAADTREAFAKLGVWAFDPAEVARLGASPAGYDARASR